MKIYIKNMACESCKIVVKDALDDLNIVWVKVDLGEIEIKEDISDAKKAAFNNKIKVAGLELLEQEQGIMTEKTRRVAIDFVYKSDEKSKIKFSVLLSKELNHSYSYLAKFF